MDVRGDYTLDAPQDLAWKALQDPQILASVMPGSEDFKETGENEYSGILNIKVGPVQGKFNGTIKLTDIVAPEGYNILVDGKGSPGFVKANGSLKLTGQGDKTYMEYQGQAQIGGRIASVGQRLLEASTTSIIRQSLEGLNEYLKAQVVVKAPVEAADTAGEEVTGTIETTLNPDYKPPSQSAIAKNVFKDVASDIIPPKYRPVIIGVGVIVLILILYQILR